MAYRTLLAILLACAAPAGATTLLSTIDTLGGYDTIGAAAGPPAVVRAAMASWSQTGTFTNVAIAAEVDPGQPPTVSHTSTGTAYLMTQVGPGTTTAEELANTPFSVTGAPFNPTLVTLFTGLTLGPGSYFLVLSAPADQTAGWDFAVFPSTPQTAPGVTLTATNLSGIEAAYPPATSFTDTFDNILQFSVVGDVASEVPEPGSLALLLIGGLLLTGRLRYFSSL